MAFTEEPGCSSQSDPLIVPRCFQVNVIHTANPVEHANNAMVQPNFINPVHHASVDLSGHNLVNAHQASGTAAPEPLPSHAVYVVG